MITLNVTPDGEITISQETPGERKLMREVYSQEGQIDPRSVKLSSGDVIINGVEVSAETQKDEERSAFFKQGWDMAIAECQMNFVKGRLVEFFNEIGTGISTERSEDPHHNEPGGTGEAQEVDVEIGADVGYWPRDDIPAAGWADTPTGRQIQDNIARAQEAQHAANEIGLDIVRPVTDSGEPELEAESVDEVEPGMWHMSNEELNSRINEAYRRGREEGYRDGFGNGQTVSRQTTKRALDIIAVEINNQVVQWWDEQQSSDDVIRESLSKGTYARKFAELLAQRLGYEVSA